MRRSVGRNMILTAEAVITTGCIQSAVPMSMPVPRRTMREYHVLILSIDCQDSSAVVTLPL